MTRARRAASEPSAEELDLRDRLKAQPRRPAGPPLVGDVLTRSAMDALRTEVVPEPTDPLGGRGSGRKGRGSASRTTRGSATRKTSRAAGKSSRRTTRKSGSKGS